jgi:phospholipase/carboxylesterase
MEKLSLQYIVREPKIIKENTSLLILLHGYGSNEEDLFSFASELPEDLIIVSARAPQTLGYGSYSWYTIHFNSPQGKFSDMPEAIKSRETIAVFIDEVQQKYGISPKKTFLLGFSQGNHLKLCCSL